MILKPNYKDPWAHLGIYLKSVFALFPNRNGKLAKPQNAYVYLAVNRTWGSHQTDSTNTINNRFLADL